MLREFIECSPAYTIGDTGKNVILQSDRSLKEDLNVSQVISFCSVNKTTLIYRLVRSALAITITIESSNKGTSDFVHRGNLIVEYARMLC